MGQDDGTRTGKSFMRRIRDGGAVFWALASNVIIAIMKFICAGFGSVAMLGEGIHSLVDSANERGGFDNITAIVLKISDKLPPKEEVSEIDVAESELLLNVAERH